MTRKKLTSAVRTLIRKAIAHYVRNKLQINALSGHRAEMVSAVDKMFENSNKAMQRRLENDRKGLKLKRGQRRDEYMSTLRVLRRKMYQNEFPTIEVELILCVI